MIFNDFAFLLVFLPAVATIFFIPFARRWRRSCLLVASLVFYGVSGPDHLAVLIIDIIVVYAAMARPKAQGNKIALTIAILVPATALINYKYIDFIITNFVAADAAATDPVFSLFHDIILPAGISFFTFQVISYAIDRYRGTVDQPPFVSFALYISFFPQLVAGPILRYHDVKFSIEGLVEYVSNKRDIADAIGFFVLGLGSKVLLADNLHHFIGPLSVEPGRISSLGALYVLLGYSFQIYFDFYGYSLCAIGLGRLFGFRFPDNFRRPYEALNPKEFWRKWHITLSFWIRDYLYLPLGGNRNYGRNIFIIFAACGLWHGAGWSFVAWGLFHAVLVYGYDTTSRTWDKMPPILQRSLNFLLVSAGWTLFLFDFESAAAFWRSFLGANGLLDPSSDPNSTAWFILAISAIFCFRFYPEKFAQTQFEGRLQESWRGVLLAVIFLASLLFIGQSQTFIYFRF